MRRREFITLLGGAGIAWPLNARAQPTMRIRRIAVLMGIAENDRESQVRLSALQTTLRRLGWVEGNNIQIDYRWTGGDLALAKVYAAELVGLNPDVIVAHTTPVLRALRNETRTITLVFALVADPVGGGFVSSMAQPGGHITGFTGFEFSVGSKWMEALKEVAPRVARAAFVFNPDSAPFAEKYVRAAEAVGPLLAVKPITAPVRDGAELERSMASFAAEANGGLIIVPSLFTAVHREAIVALAARYRLPAIYPFRYFSILGGLLSYGIDTAEVFGRVGSYVDRILRGAKPADLPVQVPTKFELVINLKTAKALGLDVPPTLLASADEVIE
jgi:ABC-type uncharacterized transport system substrate-binding protein